ncbi:MAG: GNAT family N-acetyltransferase [Verrucomicrobiota bacterium]|nr:GNAT family N-acetyltransferase [Verrucomicrobiota bacterium]
MSKKNIIKISFASETDIKNISKFVNKIFDEYVGPTFSDEGKDDLHEYMQKYNILARTQANHWILIAELQGKLIGMIEVKDNNHISLLFVAKNYQKTGVGSLLFKEALKISIKESENTSMTVHAVSNAVKAYKKYGFKATNTEQCENGIKFIPMKRKIQ